MSNAKDGELLRIDFRIITVTRDAEGSITGERMIAEGAVYPPALDQFPGEVRSLVARAQAAGESGTQKKPPAKAGE